MVKFMDENSVTILWQKIKNVFLSKIDAASTYLSKNDAANSYLSKTDAASTYATKTENNAKQDLIDNDNKLSTDLISGLATVATSGEYNDLNNKPSIPNADELATINNLQTIENNFNKKLENYIQNTELVYNYSIFDLSSPTTNKYKINLQNEINNASTHENTEDSFKTITLQTDTNLVDDIFNDFLNNKIVILLFNSKRIIVNNIYENIYDDYIIVENTQTQITINEKNIYFNYLENEAGEYFYFLVNIKYDDYSNTTKIIAFKQNIFYPIFTQSYVQYDEDGTIIYSQVATKKEIQELKAEIEEINLDKENT